MAAKDKEAIRQDILNFIDKEVNGDDLVNNPEMVVAITGLYQLTISKNISKQKYLEKKDFEKVLNEALDELTDRINYLH